MFFAKVPNSILKPKSSSSSSIKHPIREDNSFLSLVSNSRIWLFQSINQQATTFALI
jgi:hypothetical protein